MQILFSAYPNIFYTKDFIFHNGKYYYIKNNFIIPNKTMKIEKRLNRFLFSFSSKLLNGYYTLDFVRTYRPNKYTVSNYLTTIRQNPMNPIVTSGCLFIIGNLTLPQIVYTQLDERQSALVYIANYLTACNGDINNDQVNRCIEYLNYTI